MSDTNPMKLTPYARSLGIEAEESGGDAPTLAPLLAIDFSRNIEGRPGHFHGGATAGLLEAAGYAILRATLEQEDRAPILKPVNITVQYLSGGKQKRTYARGRITRLGRRNANVTVEAWQDDPSRPIATAVMNILMAEPQTKTGE